VTTFRNAVSHAIHGRFPNADLLHDSEGSFGRTLSVLPTDVGSTVTIQFALSGLREPEVVALAVGLLSSHPSADDGAPPPTAIPYPVVGLSQVILHNKRVMVVHFSTVVSAPEARQALRKVALAGLPGPLGDILLAMPSDTELASLATAACCWYVSSPLPRPFPPTASSQWVYTWGACLKL
jgi:hypothetical protein